MSIWQIIGCAMIYLVIGAVINGFADIDSDEDSFYGILFFWPVAIVLVVMVLVSTTIRLLVHGFKEKFNG